MMKNKRGTPGLLKRIGKFHSDINKLEGKAFNNLKDLVDDFVDQSHYYHIYKGFTGFTPIEYLINFITDQESEYFYN